MTDMELEENNEKSSDFAKLRASLKEKYEWQIQKLQERIDSLEKSNKTTRKSFFSKSLKNEWYEGEDIEKFIEKYPSLEVDEVIALYKGMNPKKEAPKTEPAAPATTENVSEERGSQSVLWTNPTAMSANDDVDKMNGQQYLDYLKRNMSQLGLE